MSIVINLIIYPNSIEQFRKERSAATRQEAISQLDELEIIEEIPNKKQFTSPINKRK